MRSSKLFIQLSRANYYSKVVGWMFVSCMVLALVGCGDGRPSRVPVSGKITIDGKPISKGGISFKPVEGGRIAGGAIGSGGTYSPTMYAKNDGLPPGSYTVTISAVQEINENSNRWLAPKKYANHDTSGLTVEISEPTEELNFELTWEGDKHSGPWVESF